jgi:hypothetical protein
MHPLDRDLKRAIEFDDYLEDRKMEFSLTCPEPKDTRFIVFKDYIFRMFHWVWDCDPRWGPMEARQLKSLLEENPNMTDRDFALALKNIAQSDDIPARQRPGYWLPRLDEYIVHNHDRFRRDPNAKSGETFDERDATNTAQAARRILENLSRNNGNGAALGQVNERRANGTVTQRSRALPSGSD